LFTSIADFALYFIDQDKSVKHKQSTYVADRDDEGVISFLGATYEDEALILDDDGDAIYTQFETINND